MSTIFYFNNKILIFFLGYLYITYTCRSPFRINWFIITKKKDHKSKIIFTITEMYDAMAKFFQ